MARILIVEDEAQIARFVELELIHEGYEVAKTDNGRGGLDLALEQDFDLLLLDVMLPGLNGIEVLRRLRQEKQTPVILLTARDAVMDKVAGLDAGADDYVTKPFAIEELLARIRTALKRRGGATETKAAAVSSNTIRVRDVELDPDRYEVKVKGDPVELTNHEFVLLQTLMENCNVVMNRENLISRVCGYDYVGETNVIDVYVRYLRSKIDEKYGIHLISTVRGVGYVIRSEES